MDIGLELRWFGKILSPELEQVKILVLSDTHYGNPYCSIKHFAQAVNFVREDNECYCFFNGDLCESSIRTSKGDIFRQVGTPQDQRDWVIEQLLPIKDKILGMTTGNHEERINKETGIDISADIAQALGVPYRPEGMLHKLSFGSGSHWHKEKPFVFWGYISHGYGGARTKAAKAVKVERMSSWVHADYYAMSHDHVVNVSPNIRLIADNRGFLNKETGFFTGKVTAHREMLIKTNAFVKFGGYAEMGGFSPSDLCTPIIHLLTPQSLLWENYPETPSRAVKVSI